MFLIFVTGSDRVPIGGLNKMNLTIERMCPDSNNLPTSHTCSDVLLLPDYSSKAKLKSKLELALKYNKGFGLI
jgi:ubiquitin-protein ligase E3 A